MAGIKLNAIIRKSEINRLIKLVHTKGSCLCSSAKIRDKKTLLAEDNVACAKANAKQVSPGFRPNNVKQKCVTMHLWKLVGVEKFKFTNYKRITGRVFCCKTLI